MGALVRNWWMMAIRGGLAIVFGLTVLMWPDITLSHIVVLFGVYAMLDGGWTGAAAVRASAAAFEAWPLLIEGLASIALGLLALMWPTVPRELVYVLAGWGLATGALELLAARSLPRSRPAAWLLGTAGASSLFLALLVLVLPYASVDFVSRVIAAYAQVFGVALLLAALDFPRGRPSGRAVAP
ncbi:MAG TPA: DUF308 domain-containing protein [Candidatus Binatia bacterium]|nr:DUF308 domain-containing protein [Candidatus Binatia bacterium]